ncbi:MAG: serine/threonine-protein kinase [Cyanobacteria bacterium P01_A01_bin.84]
MSYCLNPNCSNPENKDCDQRCHSCGCRLLLRDRYQVLKALGQGGFGATFFAKDRALPGEPSCVIKQLRPSASAPHVLQMARELFEREAVTLGKIGNHPQLPRLLDYFEHQEQFYLVQEYIGGQTIQQEVKRNGIFSEHKVKEFLVEILPLLQYLHERQVIHRDIKPANLIRRAQDNRLVLIDFGAVKNQVTQTATLQTGHTAFTSYAIGTPGFAPPEQMAMRPVYASDIYAVGVTCIYLFTGKTPKDLEYNPTTGEMMWEKLVTVSQHFQDVLHKMLEVSVHNRYRSAEEVYRVLEMEPYLDSLADGLVSQSNTNSKDNKHSSYPFENSNSNSGNSSTGVEQVAAAIRARRAKNTEASSSSNQTRQRILGSRSYGNTQASKNSSSSTARKSRSQKKLNSDALFKAYLKGRRDFALYNLVLLNLPGADLSGTNFHSAKLDKANLQNANLCDCDFGRASLNRANLRDTNLSKTYFSHADLEGADLRGADLSNAYMSHANLRGTNLCGANLSGAKITEEQLMTAKTNWMTVRPNGRRGLL